MALPWLRAGRLAPVLLGRLSGRGRLLPGRLGAPRLPPPAPARPCASGRGGGRQKPRTVVVEILNPLVWIRTRVYFFLIRAYFDQEFDSAEFAEGAKQAFSRVSCLLSQSRYEALDGLVTKDLMGKLEEKCNLLPLNYRKALSADPEEIIYTTTEDVGIYYDNNGRKFVCILMRFWYLTNVHLPNNTTHIFRATVGGEAETKRLLTANYEFQREFTKGVAPEWTITRIEHPKLLD